MGFLELLIFSLFILGSLGDDDDCDVVSPYTKCLHHVPREKLNEIKVVPDREELRDICPGQLSYFECFTDHLDECGQHNEHYTVIEFMKGAYEITKELCDENSELHQGYIDNAECYKSLEEMGDVCDDEAKDIYEAYFRYVKEEYPERLDAIHKSSQRVCMTQSYKLACLSEKVLKICGESAQNIFTDIVSRSQYLRQFCSQSMVEEMRNAFLLQLEKEGGDVEVYQNAFGAILK